jgi:hypothetical protein
VNPKLIRSHDALMKAFAVAEMVISALPEPPYSVDIDSGIPYAVRLYFHNAPHLVADFANRNSADVTTRQPFDGSESRVYTESVIVIDGVTVRAWALTDVAPKAVAA